MGSSGRVKLSILIPAYEPDERLLALLTDLKPHFYRLILVDDGSSLHAAPIFEQASQRVDVFLRHEQNRGKGAAIKTGLDALEPDESVLTVDADGQHLTEDILAVAEAAAAHPETFVLGVRNFDSKVPLRSRFGNWWTRIFFFLLTRFWVKDTQTGLRVIPSSLRSRIRALPGERYEYEMVMLADARNHPNRPIQVPIHTIYIDGNAKSHFRPLKDTGLIYHALFAHCFHHKV